MDIDKNFDFVCNAKYITVQHLPKSLYFLDSPAYDEDDNEMDASWCAVYRKRSSVNEEFQKYMDGLIK